MAGRIRPGMPIPGSEKTISRSAIAAALGLPAGKPPEPMAPPLSPAQQRAKEAGKPLPPGDETYERITIAAGRDVLEVFGGEGAAADLPVGVEADLGPPQPKPQGRSEGEAMNGPSPEESAAEVMRDAARQADEIRAYARSDAERAKARAQAAIESGTPEEREAAVADARATVAFAQRVKEKIGL